MKIEFKKFEDIDYIVRYPNGYLPDQKYPVIIFLHGSGWRGNDISKLSENPYFTITQKYDNFPFITIAPQCSEDTWFDMLCKLKGLVEKISNAEYTDSNKMYLMGVSMGGYGAWQLAMSIPQYFAALVAMCGGGMYWNAERLVGIPVWAFHGGKDICVFPEESQKMVDAINKFGGNAKLTIYPDNEHDAWTDTYSNKEVFDWLLKYNKITNIN